MTFLFRLIISIFFVILGVAQMYVGYLEMNHYIGPIWAVGAICLCLLVRFTLPITVAAFFGATDILGWPWIGAMFFAVPGLAFLVPGVLGMIISIVKR
ncbi:MAG: hypothetical protein IPP74_08310 [Alphaproteobacteria bacterium]|nr:hypothetical protein [Alphaproteobacteria bacterium]